MARTNNDESILPIILGSLVLATFGGGGALIFSGPGGAAPATYAALVLDASCTSRESDRCDDSAGIAARIAEGAHGPIELTVYATGDRTTDSQPVRLDRLIRASQPKLAEAHSDSGPDRAFREGVRDLCGTMENTQESPLFPALSVAVADLADEPCSELRVECSVWFRTDGLEEVDTVVTAALAGQRSEHSWRIDNEHIDVVLCGLAAREVRGRNGEAGDLGAVARAFLPEFSTPDRVRFLPHCPIAG